MAPGGRGCEEEQQRRPQEKLEQEVEEGGSALPVAAIAAK